MDAKLVNSISSQIYRRFPEVSGSEPKVQRQSGSDTKGTSDSATYLLTYRGKAITSDGKSISRLVRVVADGRGKILKVTTSR